MDLNGKKAFNNNNKVICLYILALLVAIAYTVIYIYPWCWYETKELNSIEGKASVTNKYQYESRVWLHSNGGSTYICPHIDHAIIEPVENNWICTIKQGNITRLSRVGDYESLYDRLPGTDACTDDDNDYCIEYHDNKCYLVRICDNYKKKVFSDDSKSLRLIQVDGRLFLYATGDDKVLYCVEGDTVKQIFKTSNGYMSTFGIGNSHVYYSIWSDTNIEGTGLYMIDLTDNAIIQLSDKAFYGLFVFGDRLYASSEYGNLYTYDNETSSFDIVCRFGRWEELEWKIKYIKL